MLLENAVCTLEDIKAYIDEQEAGFTFFTRNGLKTCTVCMETKDVVAFGKQEQAKDSMNPRCKQCEKKKRIADEFYTEWTLEGVGTVYLKRYKSRAGGISWYLVDVKGEFISKRCADCGEMKLKDGYSESNKLGGVRSICRECDGEHKVGYRAENAEHLKEYMRQYQAENADHIKEYQRQYRAEKRNDPTWVEKQRERQRQRYVKEPERFQAKEAKRNALKRNLHAEPNWANNWADIMERFHGRCALTGDVLDESQGNSHCEHFIPLSWGHGGTSAANCYPLRSDLNISKGNRNPFEWFQAFKDRYGLSQDRFDELVLYLAMRNDMTPEEFEKYVYWCERNKRTPEECAEDTRPSSEIFKEAQARGEV
ncbi:hypothetical protein CHL76_02450 [Marinococcus halophilus]|uniref:HNH nuclease domain-containing protein n=1 Tax=Marinococcus halophilus TaxID=1371 RepID=A0A510Y3L9_MARHA|nr:hypothetical protein [Marinococcus halophilus]OZT81236.1 hypothetical protein CHL76_02450 [Marinococcus halophilus]GEK57177.1 hypothetical protein MHA01_00820 [Marinococcus halophilus]